MFGTKEFWMERERGSGSNGASEGQGRWTWEILSGEIIWVLIKICLISLLLV